ncbi:MAG: class I SAM-dependent methyltransferase [Alphaproteobacteria bacterium]|nr:class I SAM-dependent methyltransferase [Alphaproteobacteria bacterium]MCB9794402.1 class I SAM-dependent methyltransferase [Alphaproteobacteria bacterium]
MIACPECGGALSLPGAEPLRCACGADYARRDGVWDLYRAAPDAGEDEAVTAEVKAFYEERPFPNYREDDDRGSLLRRGRANGFTRALDEAIPPRARVVELGCGTGQLPLFLGLAGREVVGVDLTQASLATGEAFRRRAGIDSVTFLRGNLFRPPIAEGSADVAISTGVLHHTADPKGGFLSLARLAKPGGYVIVGLYNSAGRALLPLLRRQHAQEAASGRRGEAWYHDQHHHPHERRHSVDEVLGWLDEAGLDYVSAMPSILPGVPTPEGRDLLKPSPRGGRFGHWMAQLSWLGRAADGGLWITVGRRRG